MINKTVLTYILIVGIAGGVGATTGIIGKRILGQEEIDYSGFNPEEFKMDSVELLKTYYKDPAKTVKESTPAALVNIGLEKYRQNDNNYSVTIGTAETIVSQTIRNYQIKNGNTYFEESISNSSMVKLANRVIQDGVNAPIVLYKGSAVSATEGSYPETGESFEKSAYKERLGKTLDEMFIYLISDKTTISDGSKVEKLSTGDIKVTLNLNPDISTFFYKFQMKNISGLDRFPSFEYVKLTYTFASNMDIKHCKVDEKYSASMGVTVNITNGFDIYYHPNEYIKIPNYNEPLDYSQEGDSNNG